MEKSILITGGCGFIASNFIPYFLEKYPMYRVINLDKLTYAADMSNLAEVASHPRYHFVRGDIRSRDLVEYVFSLYDVRGVIHFAAESHVDNSIHNPGVFVETNVLGTYILLDVARHSWMKSPHEPRQGYEDCRFHHISTDEVYGTLGETGYFTETTPYAPNSPYSASKAGSDLMVRAYFHTYGLNTVITNCSNNYGPKQHDEKLIPTIIRHALAQEPIPLYGDGRNVRDWLYVLDHARGIDLVFHRGRVGETYAIGGRNERTNLEIAHTICRMLDDVLPRGGGKTYADLITFVQDRPGHDRRYAIDPSKIEGELGWKPEESFETGLQKTISWYIRRYLP